MWSGVLGSIFFLLKFIEYCVNSESSRSKKIYIFGLNSTLITNIIFIYYVYYDTNNLIKNNIVVFQQKKKKIIDIIIIIRFIAIIRY